MNKKGMTLIELLIVISIMATLIALAVPQIKIDKLSAAARTIFFDLHYARMQAIKEKNNFRVIFDPNATSIYQIHDDQDNDGKKDTGESIITKDISDCFRGITFSKNNNPTFNPVGTANSGTITISDGTDTKKVVFSWTGRIRIK